MLTSDPLELPAIVNLGILRGICPCACVHCPVGLCAPKHRLAKFGRAEISQALFRDYCRDVSGIGGTTRLHAVGEPTLHSRFTDLLDAIRDYGLQQKFWLFTCGLFEPSVAAQLVESLGIIEVSINSCNTEDYLRTKGVDRFGSVVRAVESMRESAVKRGSKTRIILTRVASDSLEDERFINYWRSCGFECFVRSYHSYSGLLVQLPAPLETVEQRRPKCLVPWRRLNLDGTIVPDRLVAVACFNMLFCHPRALNSRAVLGEYPRERLFDLWNNRSFGAFRRAMLAGQPTFTACDPCVECLVNDGGPRAEDLMNPGENKC